MKIPVYLIKIDLDDDESGMGAISFVEDPATESSFIYFEKQTKPMVFKIDNEYERKVTGCAIWCDKEIYRYDDTIGEYYVVFNKPTIEKIVHKYAKRGLNNLVDLQHDGKMVDGVVMVEYFIKDTEKGINPKGFDDVSDGSLFVTYKIEDDELWGEIIKPDSEFRGFSIEINADIVPTDRFVETGTDSDTEHADDDFSEWLGSLFEELSNDKKKSELELYFEVSRTDIARVIDTRKSVVIDGSEVWIHSLGKDGDTDVAVIYDPEEAEWRTITIKDIKEFEPTRNGIGVFPQVPSSITDNDDITIQRNVNSNDISDLIHNRVWVQISYDDDKPNPHTGYRQCAIVAWGTTKRGNECYRIWEQYGDSRSAAEGTNYIPNYRLVLARRCRAFKPMQNTQPWGLEVLDTSILNWNGDKSMTAVYDHITRSDFD